MRLLDIALKDLWLAVRNPFTLLMMFGAPFIITGLMYFAFGGLAGDGEISIQAMDLVVVNQDQAQEELALGDLLLETLKRAELGDLLIVTEMDQEETAREAVDQGQAGAALLIPADFSSAILAPGEKATLILIQDPTLTIGPSIVRDVIEQFLGEVSGARVAAQVVVEGLSAHGVPVDQGQALQAAQAYSAWFESSAYESQANTGLHVQSVSNEQTAEPKDNSLIASIMVSMMIFFVFFMGASSAESIIHEDEQGTLARLFTTPTARGAILGGKFLYVFLILCLQTTVLLTAAMFLFDIRWGDPLLLIGASFGMVLAASGFGVFIMSLIQNSRQTGPVLGGGLTMAGMLGGLFTTGVPNMPKVFDVVNLCVPHGWALRAFQLVFEGGALDQILIAIAVLAVMGFILLGIGIMIFRRRFA